MCGTKSIKAEKALQPSISPQSAISTGSITLLPAISVTGAGFIHLPSSRPFRPQFNSDHTRVRTSLFLREIRMRHYLSVGIIWSLLMSGMALGDDGASAQPAPTEGAANPKPTAAVPAASQEPAKTEEAKLLTAVREALERNAQEIKSLKEQYAKDMAAQQKKVEAQQRNRSSLCRNVLPRYYKTGSRLKSPLPMRQETKCPGPRPAKADY